MAPKVTYLAQWYESKESAESPYALTTDERLWRGGDTGTPVLNDAIKQAERWMTEGTYKTSRVIELQDEVPVSVMWMSAWQAPIQTTEAGGGSSGVPGESLKLLVWMDKDEGDPIHWDWVSKFRKIFDGNHNAWDFEYGREVARRGRLICYSVKLNLWPVGKKPVTQWNWWKIFDKDPDLQRDEVEVVRAHDIEPREFPSGVDLVDCAWCGKTHLKSLSWRGYNPDTDEMEQFERCRCIDDKLGADQYRIDPDGDEYEGCVVHEVALN